jgi:hypothetical protein
MTRFFEYPLLAKTRNSPVHINKHIPKIIGSVIQHWHHPYRQKFIMVNIKVTRTPAVNAGMKKKIKDARAWLFISGGSIGFSFGSAFSPVLSSSERGLTPGRTSLSCASEYLAKHLALTADTANVEIRQQQQQQEQAPQVGVANAILLFSLSNCVTSLIIIYLNQSHNSRYN